MFLDLGLFENVYRFGFFEVVFIAVCWKRADKSILACGYGISWENLIAVWV